MNNIKNRLRYKYNYLVHNIGMTLKSNLVWYISMFFLSYIYFLMTSNYEEKTNRIKLVSIKKVAIIYSKKHFNPVNDDLMSSKLQYSASNLARQIYNYFRFYGKEIFYFDHNDYIKCPPDVDLIVGIVCGNFLKISRANPKAKKVLFVVNSHPLFRLRVLIKESLDLKRTFSYSEYVSPFLFLRLIGYVDSFALIGNSFIKKTFTDYRINASNIHLLNTGVSDFLVPDYTKRSDEKIRVLFVGSHLAIRKGLFRVMQVWSSLIKQDGVNNFELVIVGGVDSFKSDLNNFLKNNQSVKYLGWIESNTDRYREVLQSSHIQLNLSIEEGQVGCVLDGMQCGIIQVITIESGIELLDGEQGFIVRHDDIEGIVSTLLRLKDKKIRNDIEKKTISLIKKTYTQDDFFLKLEKAIEN